MRRGGAPVAAREFSPMIPCISQVCSLGSPFEDDLDGVADAAGTAVEIWLTKLEEYLKAHPVSDVKHRAADRGLTLAAASYQGGLMVARDAARAEAWSAYQRRLDLCAALGIGLVVVTADFLGPFNTADVERAMGALDEAAQLAAGRNVQLALEFQARATFLNNLETAASFIGAVRRPNLGLCLDLFQYYMGPSKFEDLKLLSRQNLFHVQVCDVANRPRELATDADRILPGDGGFQLDPIFDHLRSIGYSGHVSLEILNPRFWQIPARQVGEVGLTALRRSMGLARPG